MEVRHEPEYETETFSLRGGSVAALFLFSSVILAGQYADHVSIVEMVENGIVYTVEDNSGDACRERQYATGYY